MRGKNQPDTDQWSHWDSVNDVLLSPIFGTDYIVSLNAYHPSTNNWEMDIPVQQPVGMTVNGRHSVFDPYQNVLVVFGSTISGPYLFLYRYANGPGPPPDTPPAAPTNLRIIEVSP